MSSVIFIDPDTTSDIYTLFSTGSGPLKTHSITTNGTDPTIEELKAGVDLTTDGDIVYVINGDFVTSLNSASLPHLRNYLVNLFAATNEDIDLFYLSNFMDNCINRVELKNQPTETDETNINNYSMTTTSAPNGMAGIAATKANWLTILNLVGTQNENKLSAKISALVMNEKLSAGTSQPLFVYPDLMKQTDALDVLKTQYCRIEKNFGRSVPNTENLSLFWFVAGASIVVFCAWVLSYYTPKNKVLLVKKY
jgi:hypothetical protein